MSPTFTISANDKNNIPGEDNTILGPIQFEKSEEYSKPDALPEHCDLGGQSGDREIVPSFQSDNSRKEGSVGTETSRPNKDPRLSVSEAFGIDESNLHQKDNEESLVSAVADLD